LATDGAESIRTSVKQVIGPFAQVCLAQDDTPAFFDICNDGGIFRKVVFQHMCPGRGGHPLNPDVVLNQDRHPKDQMQGRGLLSLNPFITGKEFAQSLVFGTGLLHRVGIYGNNGVQHLAPVVLELHDPV